MLKTFKNAWKIAELRSKLIFTIIVIALYRLGSVVPVPYINANALGSLFQGQNIFTYFNLISGDALSKATLFALSISPYITASIVIQLLTIAIPALERLSKEGPEGRKKLTQITRYCTVGLSLLTSFGYYTYLRSMPGILVPGAEKFGFKAIVIITCYCAGAAIIMWLAEKINDHGIGNGISIILFANIAASLPNILSAAFGQIGVSAWGILVPVITIALIAAMILFVVYVTNAERRIPVQYAKRQMGRRMYGGQNTYIPMKLNMSGVMPIIFAGSIASIPATIAMIIKPKAGGVWDFIVNKIFNYSSPVYMVIYFILIIAFSYFYLAISFNPVEISNNLKNNGGSVPGIRPGKSTTDYITKILGKVTLIGAIFLGIIATLPLFAGLKPELSGLAFGGSSLLILVSVALETQKELEAQMTMRHYKGFLD